MANQKLGTLENDGVQDHPTQSDRVNHLCLNYTGNEIDRDNVG